MNIDSVLQEQLDKVHSVQDQSIHHGLLQGVHLTHTEPAHRSGATNMWYISKTCERPLTCCTHSHEEQMLGATYMLYLQLGGKHVRGHSHVVLTVRRKHIRGHSHVVLTDRRKKCSSFTFPIGQLGLIVNTHSFNPLTTLCFHVFLTQRMISSFLGSVSSGGSGLALPFPFPFLALALLRGPLTGLLGLSKANIEQLATAPAGCPSRTDSLAYHVICFN